MEYLFQNSLITYRPCVITGLCSDLCWMILVGGGEITVGFMLFPRAEVKSETQTASSKIWTQVVDSNSYNNNYYSKRASIHKLQRSDFDPL